MPPPNKPPHPRSLICYGALAGGALTDKYLSPEGAPANARHKKFPRELGVRMGAGWGWGTVVQVACMRGTRRRFGYLCELHLG